MGKNTERDRLISSEEQEESHAAEIHYETSYKHLPVGVWFIEWMGVLSSIDPVKKKRLYVDNISFIQHK